MARAKVLQYVGGTFHRGIAVVYTAIELYSLEVDLRGFHGTITDTLDTESHLGCQDCLKHALSLRLGWSKH